MSAYAVAEMLHMPVYRLMREMPLQEFQEWLRIINARVSGKTGNDEEIDLETATPEQLMALFG